MLATPSPPHLSAAAMARAAAAACLLLALAAAAAAALPSRAASPAPAPGPAVDCSSALMGLADCLGYVSAGGWESTPSKSCCSGVKGAVQDPAAVGCLCSAFGADVGFNVNMTRAARLPVACGASAAAFSECNINVAGGPADGAPATDSPGSSTKSAATRRPPVTATALAATVAAPLLAWYCL